MTSPFNLEASEYKMLNYFTQAQEAAAKSCKHKHGTNTINIDITELSKQAVKEHKDIHKLVASKMFDVNYEAVTEEQRRIAKTVDFEYLYKAGLI